MRDSHIGNHCWHVSDRTSKVSKRCFMKPVVYWDPLGRTKDSSIEILWFLLFSCEFKEGDFKRNYSLSKEQISSQGQLPIRMWVLFFSLLFSASSCPFSLHSSGSCASPAPDSICSFRLLQLGWSWGGGEGSLMQMQFLQGLGLTLDWLL